MFKKRRPYKNSNRNFDSPEYKAWRKAVYDRDRYKCRKCHSKRSLQAHHIKTWANNPALRYSIPNGITLCWKCHKAIKGKEQSYEEYFTKLLYPSHAAEIYRIRKGLDESPSP